MWIPDLLLISSNATEVRLEYQNKNAINLNSFRKNIKDISASGQNWEQVFRNTNNRPKGRDYKKQWVRVFCIVYKKTNAKYCILDKCFMKEAQTKFGSTDTLSSVFEKRIKVVCATRH